ncbi:hypothetical protein HanIR_Chr07g0339821 [Helianthus annuus]|nr:hypothetical protein HanIR_Chr07g0339821 [Helianthus annuus]
MLSEILDDKFCPLTYQKKNLKINYTCDENKRIERVWYLENMPFDEAPITSLLILCFIISCFIASTTSSESICTISTATYIQKKKKKKKNKQIHT